MISPYVKRGAVDSTMYNTTSVLRTMELILGLRPMTDVRRGRPADVAAFQAAPDLRPYTAETPRIALDQRNPAASPRRPARRKWISTTRTASMTMS